MVWWEAVGLVSATALVVHAAVHAWHAARCPACRLAKRAVGDGHPNWQVLSTSHRAWEAGRDVVAVFYLPPDVVIEPAPYVLVAVSRVSGEVAELPGALGSPYEILGRK